MEDTLTKPAGAADAVEGEVAAALDGAAHGRATQVAEHTLDAWHPDDSPDWLLAAFVPLFNTDTRYDAATISVPLGGASAAAVASYVARAANGSTGRAARRRRSNP